MMTKTCTKCGQELSISEFWFNAKKGLHNPACRACQKLAREAWRAANPKRRREIDRAWVLANPERVKAAQERWKERNPGAAAQRAAEWYQQNKGEVRSRERSRYQEAKDTVYAVYGGKCACCGESESKFLSIDHVNNDGNIRRKEMQYGVGGNGGGIKLYATIISEGFPDTYQILCMNCNWGKARNNGVCPHQTVKVQRSSREGVGASAPKRAALVCDEVKI